MFAYVNVGSSEVSSVRRYGSKDPHRCELFCVYNKQRNSAKKYNLNTV